MILMSPVAGLVQGRPVTTSYDPTREKVGVSSELRTPRRLSGFFTRSDAKKLDAGALPVA